MKGAVSGALRDYWRNSLRTPLEHLEVPQALVIWGKRQKAERLERSLDRGLKIRRPLGLGVRLPLPAPTLSLCGMWSRGAFTTQNLLRLEDEEVAL